MLEQGRSLDLLLVVISFLATGRHGAHDQVAINGAHAGRRHRLQERAAHLQVDTLDRPLPDGLLGLGIACRDRGIGYRSACSNACRVPRNCAHFAGRHAGLRLIDTNLRGGFLLEHVAERSVPKHRDCRPLGFRVGGRKSGTVVGRLARGRRRRREHFGLVFAISAFRNGRRLRQRRSGRDQEQRGDETEFHR